MLARRALAVRAFVVGVGPGPIVILGPLALLSVLLLPGSAPASSGAVALGAAADSDPAALMLLDRAARAPDEVSYRGLQFVSAWTAHGSTGLVVDVAHRPGVGTTVRSPATASTRADQTHLPADSAAPSMLGGGSMLGLLDDSFTLSVGRLADVAGRSADVLVATRPGATRPAARFWVDRGSGLVLRREVYDESGRIIRASAFVQVRVGRDAVLADPDDAAEDAGADDTAAPWPDTIDSGALAQMRGKGWDCPAELPPSLQLVDARRGGGSYDGIVHLSYSDGLASVSVFEQRGRLDRSQLRDYRLTTVAGRRVYLRDGMPQRLVWTSGSTVYTVVADASSRTVGDVVGALPRPTDDSGAWHRLGRGLDRVASWFNPFG